MAGESRYFAADAEHQEELKRRRIGEAECDPAAGRGSRWSNGLTISLQMAIGKEMTGMDARAKMTSKGQVTIPKSVREALALEEGDELLFRVQRSRAVIAKTPDFLEHAGKVAVPVGKRGTPWDEVLRRTRRERAGRRR
jgi:AbrB family looped-hinge helix DNA binding protein